MPEEFREHALSSILEILTGSWKATCLYLGIKHRLPAHLATGDSGHSAAELASSMGLPEQRLRRLLRVWEDLEIIVRGPDGKYSLAETFRGIETDTDISSLVCLYEEDLRHAWTNCDNWLKGTSTGFEAAFGTTIHHRIEQDSAFAGKFMNGMSSLDYVFQRFADQLVSRYQRPWSVLDIGGGSGKLAQTILSRSSDVTATVQDLPHVLDTRRLVHPTKRILEHGVSFFEAIPSGFDCYILSRVLQDWDDDAATRILSNARAAVADSGAPLWVIERSAGEHRPLSNLWDVHLGCVAGGGHRTESEHLRLFRDSGWKFTERIALPFEVEALLVLPA